MKLSLNTVSLLLLKCVLLISINDCDTARILAVIPTPSISHQVVFRPLTQELARRGHEVVVITTDPAFPKGEAPTNLTEIDVHDISYEFWTQNFKLKGKGWAHDPVAHIEMSVELFANVFEIQLQNEEVKKIIREESFDLVIVEMFVKPAYVLSHIFKAPMILISSAGAGTGIYDIVGAPTHPILYPALMRQRIYNLTLFEKVNELYNHYLFAYKLTFLEQKINEMLKRNLGSDVPDLQRLNENVDLIFINIHPVFEGNYPVPPAVVYIWGIHKEPGKNMSDNLKSFLNNSKNGVIYMSFGTNVHHSMLPPDKIKIMVKVLSQLEYDVLWKWDKDGESLKAPNIKIDKWFPQSSLLKHPNIKLFITQGGLQSTEEAITAEVPLIGIPMIAEQWYNTEKYEHHRIGKKLDIASLTEEQFRTAVLSVIEDKSYKQNVVRLKGILSDQPQPALERAVWWTEYVLRHGGARHLRAPAANISWAHFLELELLSILLGISLIILLLFTSVIYCLCRWLQRKPEKRKTL